MRAVVAAPAFVAEAALNHICIPIAVRQRRTNQIAGNWNYEFSLLHLISRAIDLLSIELETSLFHGLADAVAGTWRNIIRDDIVLGRCHRAAAWQDLHIG